MLKFEIEINREDKRDKEFIAQDIKYLKSVKAQEQRIIDAAEDAKKKMEKIDAQLIKLGRELWEVI